VVWPQVSLPPSQGLCASRRDPFRRKTWARVPAAIQGRRAPFRSRRFDDSTIPRATIRTSRIVLMNDAASLSVQRKMTMRSGQVPRVRPACPGRSLGHPRRIPATQFAVRIPARSANPY
jgi:hypothetical protein